MPERVAQSVHPITSSLTLLHPGVKLPAGVGTKPPEDVANAVIEGIEKNKAEIDVAPIAVRATGKLAGIAPAAVTAVNRRR